MKRASRKNKLVVGGFVVLMGLLAAVSVLLFSDDVTMFKPSTRYFAAFKDTSGLHVGAPIKMGASISAASSISGSARVVAARRFF